MVEFEGESSWCVEEGGEKAAESFRSDQTVGAAGKAANRRHRRQCVTVLRCG